MSPIKLTYFPITALGEPIRLLLAYGNLDFEDERIMKETFLDRKPILPYGKLPVLEMEGRTLHQSMAICRHLARRVGLVGDTDMDALETDIQVDCIGDLRAALATVHYENHEEAKAQKREAVMSTQVPYIVARLEEQVRTNAGYFVNGKLTWADLWYVGIYTYLNYMAGKDIFFESPKLQDLQRKVFALPQLQKYLASRPSVPF